MQETLILLASSSAVFAIGFVAAKTYTNFKLRPSKAALTPVANAKVKLKTNDALYRCRLISHDQSSWVFTAPMQSNYLVPLAIGEEIVCEVVGQGGLLRFKTKVIARRAIEGSIVVAAPAVIDLDDRRDVSERRETEMEVVVGGKFGSVMDLGSGGAKVKLNGFEREGNMVRVELPNGEIHGATVVDSKNDHLGSTVRLRFDS